MRDINAKGNRTNKVCKGCGEGTCHKGHEYCCSECKEESEKLEG